MSTGDGSAKFTESAFPRMSKGAPKSIGKNSSKPSQRVTRNSWRSFSMREASRTMNFCRASQNRSRRQNLSHRLHFRDRKHRNTAAPQHYSHLPAPTPPRAAPSLAKTPRTTMSSARLPIAHLSRHFVFKTYSDPFTGRVSLYRGLLRRDDVRRSSLQRQQKRGRTIRPDRDHAGQNAGYRAQAARWRYRRRRQNSRRRLTGDTLADKTHEITYPSVKWIEPVILSSSPRDFRVRWRRKSRVRSTSQRVGNFMRLVGERVPCNRLLEFGDGADIASVQLGHGNQRFALHGRDLGESFCRAFC